MHAYPKRIDNQPDIRPENEVSEENECSEALETAEDIDEIEEAMQTEDSMSTADVCNVLRIDRNCALCDLVNECIQIPAHINWLLNYCLLCYKSCYAPRTALTTLLLGTEFITLASHHLNKNLIPYIEEQIITPMDIQVHFFINRCFSSKSADMVQNENITILHFELLKDILTESATIPFKKNFVCSSEIKKNALYEMQNEKTTDSFIDIVAYIWGNTIFFPLSSNTTFKSIFKMSRPETERLTHLGPIFLSPHPIVAQKNNTSTICLMCELCACSYEACRIVEDIKKKVEEYCENNLKIIDKISYVTKEILQSLKNQKIAEILKFVGPVGMYKHYYCDIMCSLNFNTVNADILFGILKNESEAKLEICHSNEFFSKYSKSVWLFAQLYKAFQTAPNSFRRKTQVNDFVREAKALLKKLNISLVDLHYTLENYV